MARCTGRRRADHLFRHTVEKVQEAPCDETWRLRVLSGPLLRASLSAPSTKGVPVGMQAPQADLSVQGQRTFAAAAVAVDGEGLFSVAPPRTTSAVSPGMVGAGVDWLRLRQTEKITGEEAGADFAMTSPVLAGVVVVVVLAVVPVAAKNVSLAVT